MSNATTPACRSTATVLVHPRTFHNEHWRNCRGGVEVRARHRRFSVVNQSRLAGAEPSRGTRFDENSSLPLINIDLSGRSCSTLLSAAAAAAVIATAPGQCLASGLPSPGIVSEHAVVSLAYLPSPRQSDSFVSLKEWKEKRKPSLATASIGEKPPKMVNTIPEAVADIQRLMEAARKATDDGEYKSALNLYSQVVDQYPDLAITDYARIGRGLMLFQDGQRSQAILELEDLDFSFKGSAELSAAITAALYSERPGLLQRAEAEWRIVDSFDRRYYDPKWVASEKHWPPAMVDALDRFLHLS